jgi:hypothetical protein
MRRPIKPDWLIRQANELGGRYSPAGQPRNADLRRAVSAAYYALFHYIALSVAEQAVPTGSEDDRYRFARHVEHASIRVVCDWVGTGKTPPPSVQDAVALMRGSADLQDVAFAFLDLYANRHDADYDHFADFTRTMTLTLIDQAEDAIWKLDNTKGTPERESFLAHVLLLTKRR